MAIAFPGESAEYRAARNRLLEQEIELRRAMEAVAAARRCTAFLDQLDGAAEHGSQRINLAVAGKAPIERILAFASERGWRLLRLLSSAGTSYNHDYLAGTADGNQQPATHAERVSPRRGDDPPLLGLRTFLRTSRARTGTPPHRHHRADVEPV
jgi:predicted dithiol-disulfide oxidoreductase (DUF899 family)